MEQLQFIPPSFSLEQLGIKAQLHSVCIEIIQSVLQQFGSRVRVYGGRAFAAHMMPLLQDCVTDWDVMVSEADVVSFSNAVISQLQSRFPDRTFFCQTRTFSNHTFQICSPSGYRKEDQPPLFNILDVTVVPTLAPLYFAKDQICYLTARDLIQHHVDHIHLQTAQHRQKRDTSRMFRLLLSCPPMGQFLDMFHPTDRDLFAEAFAALQNQFDAPVQKAQLAEKTAECNQLVLDLKRAKDQFQSMLKTTLQEKTQWMRKCQEQAASHQKELQSWKQRCVEAETWMANLKSEKAELMLNIDKQKAQLQECKDQFQRSMHHEQQKIEKVARKCDFIQEALLEAKRQISLLQDDNTFLNVEKDRLVAELEQERYRLHICMQDVAKNDVKTKDFEMTVLMVASCMLVRRWRSKTAQHPEWTTRAVHPSLVQSMLSRYCGVLHHSNELVNVFGTLMNAQMSLLRSDAVLQTFSNSYVQMQSILETFSCAETDILKMEQEYFSANGKQALCRVVDRFKHVLLQHQVATLHARLVSNMMDKMDDSPTANVTGAAVQSTGLVLSSTSREKKGIMHILTEQSYPEQLHMFGRSLHSLSTNSLDLCQQMNTLFSKQSTSQQSLMKTLEQEIRELDLKTGDLSKSKELFMVAVEAEHVKSVSPAGCHVETIPFVQFVGQTSLSPSIDPPAAPEEDNEQTNSVLHMGQAIYEIKQALSAPSLSKPILQMVDPTGKNKAIFTSVRSKLGIQGCVRHMFLIPMHPSLTSVFRMLQVNQQLMNDLAERIDTLEALLSNIVMLLETLSSHEHANATGCFFEVSKLIKTSLAFQALKTQQS